MFNVGDKVEVRGAGVGLVAKNMMGDDYIVRMNNGQNQGVNKRALTLLESVEDRLEEAFDMERETSDVNEVGEEDDGKESEEDDEDVVETSSD